MKVIDYTKYPIPRLRHHASPNLYFPYESQKKKDVYYPPAIKSMDWESVFSNGNPPDFLDVGCGIGKFLLETAVEDSESNILGFEVRKSATEWINNVIKGENLGNALVLWYSVANGLPFIEPASIKKIFYFFPDPWVKKRHHKRRAFTMELLNEFERVLTNDGAIYFMTDVAEVNEHHKEIIDEHGGFIREYVKDADWIFSARTNKEIFCLDKDIPFVRMVCRKK